MNIGISVLNLAFKCENEDAIKQLSGPVEISKLRFIMYKVGGQIIPMLRKRCFATGNFREVV
jgi:hypothetical protein